MPLANNPTWRTSVKPLLREGFSVKEIAEINNVGFRTISTFMTKTALNLTG